MRAGLANGEPDSLALVAPQIVQHDDVAGFQRRHEKLHHPGQKYAPVDRAVDDARCGDAVGTQRSQKGHGGPIAVRNPRQQALASRRTAMRARHVGLGPGLIDKDQAFGISPALKALPPCPLSRDVRSFLLGGVQYFFKGQAFGCQKQPHGAVADFGAAFDQFGPQCPHRQVRCFGNTGQQPVPLGKQHKMPTPAHRPRRTASRRPVPLRPTHNAGGANTKDFGD